MDRNRTIADLNCICRFVLGLVLGLLCSSSLAEELKVSNPKKNEWIILGPERALHEGSDFAWVNDSQIVFGAVPDPLNAPTVRNFVVWDLLHNTYQPYSANPEIAQLLQRTIGLTCYADGHLILRISDRYHANPNTFLYVKSTPISYSLLEVPFESDLRKEFGYLAAKTFDCLLAHDAKMVGFGWLKLNEDFRLLLSQRDGVTAKHIPPRLISVRDQHFVKNLPDYEVGLECIQYSTYRNALLLNGCWSDYSKSSGKGCYPIYVLEHMEALREEACLEVKYLQPGASIIVALTKPGLVGVLYEPRPAVSKFVLVGPDGVFHVLLTGSFGDMKISADGCRVALTASKLSQQRPGERQLVVVNVCLMQARQIQRGQ